MGAYSSWKKWGGSSSLANWSLGKDVEVLDQREVKGVSFKDFFFEFLLVLLIILLRVRASSYGDDIVVVGVEVREEDRAEAAAP